MPTKLNPSRLLVILTLAAIVAFGILVSASYNKTFRDRRRQSSGFERRWPFVTENTLITNFEAIESTEPTRRRQEKSSSNTEMPSSYSTIESQETNHNKYEVPESILTLKEHFKKLDSVDTEKKTKLLIVTHMRSGSSFTGELLQHHPNVFYVYEPLLMVERHRHLKAPIPLVYLNQPHHMNIEEDANYHNLILQTLDNIINCKFSLSDIASLYSGHLVRGLATRRFYYCSHRIPGIFGIITCMDYLYKQCLSASVTVIKTIRAPMKWMPVLLMKNANAKLIYLVRDPRATIRSQYRFGVFQDFNQYSGTFCKTLYSDVKMALALRRHNNTAIVRYEDVGRNPIQVAERMFRFIGLKITDEVKQNILNITSSGHEEHCPLCVSKANSALAAQSWRLKMDYRDARIVDQNCRAVIDILGYLPLTSPDEFTNLDISYVKDVDITMDSIK